MPNKPLQSNTITLDATNQRLGRLASVVARHLMGKTSASYAPEQVPRTKVVIQNIKHLKIDDRKLVNEKYWKTSRYPGGMKSTSWATVHAKGSSNLFIKVLTNMLPKNRQRRTMLKHVSFE
ncbi:MAG: uL13 family ribosomal protein [Candidatus Kerfeldbacteria bacterium]|nr:uL13 family ribosomal protein [Candidatus Kerfeldbacteria bacterium]